MFKWITDFMERVITRLQEDTKVLEEASALIEDLHNQLEERTQQLVDLAVVYERELSCKQALYNYLNEVREHGETWAD